MSLGLYNRSILLELSVKYAQARGDLIVASAGNSATDQKRYPAAYSGVIGVAATDSQNHKAAFSNYGDNARISAPGVNIYSAYYTGGYAYGDGTSFAAPQVAGLAAQVWSENSGVSAGSVSSRILNNAVSLLTADPTYGARLGMGLINNYKAVFNS
jgi:subtilisin family serine protease